MSNFPICEIKPTDRILCLFAAAFLGENDVQHIKQHGCTDVVIVDTDYGKLMQLADMTGYDAVCMNAFLYIDRCDTMFDVVVSDQWTGMDGLIHGDYLEKIKAISKRVAIIGVSGSYADTANIDKGTLLKRSDHEGGVYWRVVHV